MTQEITLTEEQQFAVTHILEYFRNPKPGKKYWSLGGFAGTGKTTIIKEVVRQLNNNGEMDEEYDYITSGTITATTAFTGKAVSVLRRKGLPDSQTLHSLMYQVYQDEKKKVQFRRRDSIEPDFLIIDEGSMISRQLFDDLCYFNLPMLFVGDPGQLEPIGENPNLMRSCDYVLSKIHRQASDNPIIRFANDIRNGKMWGYGITNHNDSVALDIRTKSSDMGAILEVDQVITSYNKKRLEINRMIRELKGYREPLVLGEKLICLRNNRDLGIFNGQQFYVERINSTGLHCYSCDLKDDLGSSYSDISILRKGLNGGFDEKREQLQSGQTLFDYGYCITCHKSQGSEWDSVLVVEDYAPPKLWSMPRWQYTAATRASKKLIYVR